MDKRRDRGSRKKRFADDDFFPLQDDFSGFRGLSEDRPADRTSESESIESTVKWFNAEKGFGFVELADGSGDVFIHIRQVEDFGLDDLAPGSTLKVQVGPGQKGRQVLSITEVGEVREPLQPHRPSNRKPAGNRQHETSNATSVSGTVKWFNENKGFGFVAADDGAKDVFVHIKVVRQSGMDAPPEGQRVSMQVVPTPRGREAVSIRTEE